MKRRSVRRLSALPLLRPAAVHAGATLAIVAPASPPADPKKLDAGVAALERLGCRVKLARHVRSRRGYLAGTDRERAGDLMRAFLDRSVDAIIALRGGYGASRLLPLLDYAVIRRNAKAFVGYSDLTALHCAFLTQARMISFHGPHVVGDFARSPLENFTVASFQRVLAGGSGDIADGHRGEPATVLRGGRARGRLVGGNLSLLCSLIGTPWLPDFQRRILFFEDVGEPPYRIDRMLTQLLNAGLLRSVCGVAVGMNARCEDPNAKVSGEFRQTVDEVLCERLKPLRVPVVTGLPFGHVPANATLPMGARALLDAGEGRLMLEADGLA